MITKEISKYILTIGSDPLKSKGGIAQLLKSYTEIYETFNFVSSHRNGNILQRSVTAVNAVIRVFYFFIFHNIKIVHIHTASYSSFYRKCVFINLSKLFRKKVTLHVHGGGLIDFYNTNTKFVKRNYNKADLVITIAKTWEEFIRENALSTNIITVGNIVTIPNLNNGERISEKIIKILFLGVVTQKKGIYDVIKIITDNKEVYNDKIELHIGGVDNENRLQQLISDNKIGKLIKYHGWCDLELKTKLLKECNIIIQPSYIEALGISIIEGMTYKMAIIGSNVGGIPDLVEQHKNGILITPGNLEEIKSAIDFFIANPEKIIEYGKCSFEKSQEYYPEVIEQKLTNIYKNLLN